jgi:hypothetical protein
VAEAPEAGCEVFWGAGDELGQALPSLPFLDGLRVREPSVNPRRTTIVRLVSGEYTADRGSDVPTVLAEQLLAVDEAGAADVLAESGHGLGFRHPLIRAARRGTTRCLRRCALPGGSRRVGETSSARLVVCREPPRHLCYAVSSAPRAGW